MRVHYPRTPHLPWSPGASSDDVRAGDLSGLAGREVVVTEKLDGENTTLYADGLHARSLDSAHHPSRAWVKGLQGRIGAAIPPGWRVCGENLYARHSLRVPGPGELVLRVLGLGRGDRCLDWDRRCGSARRLGVPVPPVLWRGMFDERALRALRLDTDAAGGLRRADRRGVRCARSSGSGWPSGCAEGTYRPTRTGCTPPVVENGLCPTAALWAVRSGAGPADVPAAVGRVGGRPGRSRAGRREPPSSMCRPRLDGLGRYGDARLAGVLAAMLHGSRRALAGAAARGTAGHARWHAVSPTWSGCTRPAPPLPGRERRSRPGADVARRRPGGAARGRRAPWRSRRRGRRGARAGRLVRCCTPRTPGCSGEAPLEPLRAGLRDALDRPGYGRRRPVLGGGAGRVRGRPDRHRRGGRGGDLAVAVRRVPPADPSGRAVGQREEHLRRRPPGHRRVISLDDLRQARGSRADQRANGRRSAGGSGPARRGAGRRAATVVWDATSLNQHQRSLVHGVAARRDALVTHVVVLVDEDELARRNADAGAPGAAGGAHLAAAPLHPALPGRGAPDVVHRAGGRRRHGRRPARLDGRLPHGWWTEEA